MAAQLKRDIRARGISTAGCKKQSLVRLSTYANDISGLNSGQPGKPTAVLPLMPGVDQNIATHASPTAR